MAIVYPDVPVAPGVPPVLRQAQTAVNTVVLLIADTIAITSLFAGPQWGLFDQGGAAVLSPDAVVDVEFRNEYRIADFPVEQGGFQSYDKVAMPFDFIMSFAVGGSEAERSAFLQAAGALLSSLDLLTAITPEIAYQNVNVVHLEYRRQSRRGATLIVVDVWLREVRPTGQAQFAATNVQSPSSADPASDGTVQPATPTQAQTPPA